MVGKRKYWLGIFAAILAWGVMSPVAVADDPPPQVFLTHAKEVAAGESTEFVARVINSEGNPLTGVAVSFLMEMEFQNTFGSVVIGEATTDESGVARTFYAPRTQGEVTVIAEVDSPDTGGVQRAMSALTVQEGPHLFHAEDQVLQVRARWDWLVQWIWLVILPAVAFTIYLFVMFLLWLIRREGRYPSPLGTAPPDSGNLPSRPILPKAGAFIPFAGGAAILVAASVLIIAITIRPWAGTDSGWRTELNLLHSVPDDYTRTLTTAVGQEPSLEGWKPQDGSRTAIGPEGLRLFVGSGCASCHGIDRTGAALGEDLVDKSPSDIRRALSNGPKGMPSYPSLSPEEVEALVAFITESEAPADGQLKPEVTPVPTPAPPAPVETPQPTPPPVAELEPKLEERDAVSVQATVADVKVDGDTSDWSEIIATPVILQQIKPIPGVKMGQLDPIEVNLRVAVDSERIYVLLEVPDDYDYVPDDHGLSASVAVMFRIDDPAAPHMGSTEENQRKSLGMVDIWHWELDCGPGVMSGGVTGIRGGKDPQCSLNDEWATRPTDFEDDSTRQAENSLAGVWDHTARSGALGADGTWVFEMSRMLQTGDPDDTQFSGGMTTYMALAYWDADETPDGWSPPGHLQSSSGGWIEVALPKLPP